MAYLNKVTGKEREIEFEEIDGKIQALAWSFADGFGVPATNWINLVKVSKGREETAEFQSSFESVTYKTMRKSLYNNIRSSVYENNKQKRTSIQMSIVGYFPTSWKQSTSKQINNRKCLPYVF